MDPNLFHLDWARTIEVLAAVVVLSFILERALSMLFEWRHFVNKFDKKGFKEPIAYIVALIVCIYWDFDAVSMIILSESTSLLGEAVTAGIIAGGSKGAVKLFHEVLKMQSTALREAKQNNSQSAGRVDTGGVQ